MNRFHGITSLIVFTLALLVGLIGVARDASIAAAFYAVLVGASTLIVCGVYCAKCPCREDACGHFFPGRVAQLLPPRRQAPYNAFDLAVTGAALAVMVLYPQPWLWRYPLLLILFWVLVIAAAAEIVGCVCPRCKNFRCPMKKGTTGIRSWREDRPAN